MKVKNKSIYISIIISEVLCCGSIILTSCMQPPGVLNNAGQEEKGIEIFEARKGDIFQEITTTGSVDSDACNQYTLQAQGEIIEALEKGERFDKGDILVRADDSDTLTALEEQQRNIESIEKDIEVAESSLTTARINYQKALDENHVAVQLAQVNEEKAKQASENALTSLENANRSAAISYESSELALEHAEEMLEYANTEQEENQKQYEIDSAELKLDSTAASNATSTDQAESSYDISLLDQSSTYWNNLNSTQSAEKQIALAAENINTAELKLEQAIIKLDLAKITLEKLEDDIEDYIIHSQYDGVVISNGYKKGQYPTSTQAVSVASTDFIVKATISENDIYEISEGDHALISLDAYDDAEFSANVENIIPVAVDDGGIISYEVEFSFENDKGLDVFYGLSANISIITSQAEDVIYVPLQSVYSKDGKSYVDVLTDPEATGENIGRFVEKREITTGINDYYYTEVKSGLKEGEIIITSDISDI